MGFEDFVWELKILVRIQMGDFDGILNHWIIFKHNVEGS